MRFPTSAPEVESGGDGRVDAAVSVLARMTDEELEAAIVAGKREIDARKAALAVHVAELDRRQSTMVRHLLTTKQWVSHHCRMTKAAVSTLLRIGRVLIEDDHIRERATLGEVTDTGLRMLTATALAHPEAFRAHGGPLIDAATYLSPRELRQAVSYWRQQVDYPDAVAEVAAKRRRRRFSINPTWDGMWSVQGELDPESGQAVATAIRAHVQRGMLDNSDQRTYAQRSADALVDICRHDLDQPSSDASSAGEKPHVTVEVTWETLTGAQDVQAAGRRLPEFDGLPVDAETVRRLACDAGVVRMVTGPDSEVLDIGRRTRTVPSAVRRVVDRRDGGCTVTGCDAPPGWCDAHHIVHWADGGPTSVENLRLLCRRHHTAIHESDERNRAGPAP